MDNQEKLAQFSDLFYDHYAKGEYETAYYLALAWFQHFPNDVEAISNASTCAIHLNYWDSAIECAKKSLDLEPDHLNAYDALAHAYCAKKEMESGREAGLKALAIRSQNVLQDEPLPPLPDFTPRKGKKLISFSLYGDKLEYIESAVLNTVLVSQIYPNWICRFYVDNSVPQNALDRLRHNGAEIVMVDGEIAKLPGTMWRFWAIDDRDVEVVIFRDADSVISWREADAVEQWLASGKRFHTIRDSGSHTELILAGLWGAKGGAIPDMKQKMLDYANSTYLDKRFADQYFLRNHIWKYVCQDLYGTDSIFGFMDAVPFPNEQIGKTGFVGFRETSAIMNVECEYPEEARIQWQAFSKINPLPNRDGSYELLPEERLICEHYAVVKDGKFVIPFPKRYANGFGNGNSRLHLKRVDVDISI